MKNFLMLVMAAFIGGALATPVISVANHLSAVMPYNSYDDMQKEGYSENSTDLYNWVGDQLSAERFGDHIVEVDLITFGKSAATLNEAMATMGEKLRLADCSGLDAASWAGDTPTDCVTAIDRMAALVKSLNTDTPIP